MSQLTKVAFDAAKTRMRNKEVVWGRIKELKYKSLPASLAKELKEQYPNGEMPYVVVDFNGIVGICEQHKFDTYQFQSLRGFVNYEQPFIIEKVDEYLGQILLNRIEAREQLRQVFWANVKEGMELDGYVTSYNTKTNHVFLDIYGQTCWMENKDWDHTYTPYSLNDMHKEPGDQVKVKVIRFNLERQIVQVSRKVLFPDPWVGAGDKYKKGSVVSGEVVYVSVRDMEGLNNGYLVRLDSGIAIRCDVKPGEPRPRIGDQVSVVIRRIQEDKRKGFGLIIKYVNRKEFFSNATKFALFGNQ